MIEIPITQKLFIIPEDCLWDYFTRARFRDCYFNLAKHYLKAFMRECGLQLRYDANEQVIWRI